jgi:acetyl esterase/lipase
VNVLICEKINLIEGRDDVTLTTYVLDDSPEMLRGKRRPAVIVCPGGAYLGCSDREGEPVAIRFNAMGYHAFVLRYSVYSENRGWGAIDEDPKPKKWLTHPAPMLDIARAMLEIRKNAEKWLVDMEKVAICGFSAGAHNCAMYSVYWDKPAMSEPFGVGSSDLKPAATILAYPLTDYVFMKGEYEKMDAANKGLYDMVNLAFLGTREPDDLTLDAISPARHVEKNTPPMFLWSTFRDGLVPIRHTTILADALARAGVPFEVHIFEDGDHGLSLADQTTAVAKTQIDTDAAKWASLAEAWLKKRFALDLPEKLTR